MKKLQSQTFMLTEDQRLNAEICIKTEPVESFDDDFSNMNSIPMNSHNQNLENHIDDFGLEACEADLVIHKVQGFTGEMNAGFLKNKATHHASELASQMEITNEDRLREPPANVIAGDGSNSSSSCSIMKLSHLYSESSSKVFVPLKYEDVKNLENTTDVFGLEACKSDLGIGKLKDYEWEMNTTIKTETENHVAEVANYRDRITDASWNIIPSIFETMGQNHPIEDLPKSLIPIKCEDIEEHCEEWSSYDSEVMIPEKTYAVGDLVWVYTKGHPLWPGIIFCPENEIIFTKFKYKPSSCKLSGPMQYHIQFFCYNYQTMWVSSTAIFPYAGLSYLESYFNQLKLDVKSRKNPTSMEQNLLKSFSKMSSLLTRQAKNRKALQWYQAVEEADQALAVDRSERINLFKMILTRNSENETNLEPHIQTVKHKDDDDANLSGKFDVDGKSNKINNLSDKLIKAVRVECSEDVKNISQECDKGLRIISEEIRGLNNFPHFDKSFEIASEEFIEDLKISYGKSNPSLINNSEKISDLVNIGTDFDAKNDNGKLAANNQGEADQSHSPSMNELGLETLQKPLSPKIVLQRLSVKDEEKKMFSTEKKSDSNAEVNSSCVKKPKDRGKLQRHLLARTDRHIKCTACDAVFKHRVNLKRHLIHSHLTTKRLNRERNFKSNYNFKHHNRLHSKDKYYKCLECDYKCNQKEDLKIHFQTHNKKLYKCLKCDFESNHKGNLQRHSITHSKGKLLKCVKCDYRCNHNHKRIFKCSDCDFESRYHGNLLRHSLIHNKKKLLKCVECDYTCNQKVSLGLHSLTHANEKLLKCSECDYRCNHKSSLQLHSLAHSNEKLFKCSECDYKCNQKGNLQRHSLTHTNERLFKCLECDYRCNQKGSLQRHSLTHTNERLLKCSECDYRCNHKSSLQLHSVTHTNEKLFKCPECDYKCNLKTTLKIHSLTHTDKKLFKCSECDYESNYKANFKLHELKHSNKKLFKCSFCNYECNHKGNLKTHSLKHSDVKSFQCSECDYKCKVKNSLTLHLLTHSNIKLFKCSEKEAKSN